MKKILFICFLLLSFVSNAQFNMLVDTLQLEGGGELYYYATSGDTVFINNDTIIKVDTDTYLSSVDATNISRVQFIVGTDTVYYSFGHLHTEYALQTQLTDIYDSILWRSNTDSAYLKTAKDIGMQEKNIYNADSIHANWYGGSDIVIGETGSKATINMDSVTLTNEVGIQDGSNALVTSNEIYDYIKTSGIVFVQTDATEVTNTVTETTLIGTGVGSVTFAANTLDSGDVIRVKVYGKYSNLELTGDEDVNIRVKLNSTTFVTGTLTLLNGSTDWDYQLAFDLVVQSTGSSGKVILVGGGFVDQRADAFADYYGINQTTPETINTTINQTLDITAQWTAASTDYAISAISITVEKLAL